MNLKQLDIEHTYIKPFVPTLDMFSMMFRCVYKKRFKEIERLEHLPIQALWDIPTCKKPSELFNLCQQYLKLWFLTPNDKCLLWMLWSNTIKKVTEMINSIERDHPVHSKYAGLWTSISSQFNIPAPISLLDSLSKRDNISWEMAKNMSVYEMYWKLMLDKQEQMFQHELERQTITKK